MEPSYLDIDELNYELAIRGFAETLNMRMGTEVLRESLLKESRGELDPPGMADPSIFDSEFRIVASKLDEVHRSLLSNALRFSSEVVKRVKTKLCHIKGRLIRLVINKSCADDVQFLIKRAGKVLDWLVFYKQISEAGTVLLGNIDTCPFGYHFLDEVARYDTSAEDFQEEDLDEEY